MHKYFLRAIYLTVIALIQLAPGTLHAADWSASELMSLLAQIKSSKATFVEQKYIGILDKPVESSGELYFTAPDQLEKRTLMPKTESMSLKGDELVLERGKRSMHLSLHERPEVAALVDSIRATLAGDQKALEKAYDLRVEGGPAKWTLTLKPLASNIASLVSSIRISGVRSEVHVIEIEQSGGDRSVMTISRTAGT